MAAHHDGDDDLISRVFADRYRLDAVVGRGGMATVYRAHDESLGRQVAVKLFHAGIGDVSQQESEFVVLAALDHHGLVTMIDAGVASDSNGRSRRYIVMPLVLGANLATRLFEAPISARHIGEIGYDMAEVLEYIHGKRVIHRDIKPSNILLVDYGNGATRARAKLADFGIALSDEVERMTAQGMTTGTAAYLSPEQASGGEVTTASDIYSLGLVLLECFTLRKEFPGAMVESAVARLSRDPRIPEDLPEHWRGLLRAMTSRNPAERPQGRELVSILKQIVIAESGRHKDSETLFPPDRPADAIADTPTVLDSLPTESLHRATALAARMFAAPISIVSVVDHDRTWFTSHYGAEVAHIAREVDLSKATVPQAEPVIVEDARNDPRAQGSSLVEGPLAIRFYVGVPLKRGDGQVIGTLSVLDFKPGSASPGQVENLQDIAAIIVAQLELRREGQRWASESSGSIPTPVSGVRVVRESILRN
ncbi:protein kinase [Diaminobutyricibacter tongyongensis]|uniref:Protein kinase n=1 Tax=Leifsonia tongyongensis TaxID=1268043 RepID=A0A6L9XTZ9_9MICO|nr:GAF domain-containing serine/threonine-protein kinase [Diaminobutyricibacter tongyongensis]NEN04554.1 protein kinase [Diaminobutyricibacter tongyongensis]